MSEAFLTSLGLIVVAVVTVGGQWLNSRNDRSMAHQETDLLKKLEPDSRAARDLRSVIEHRIEGWERRTRKSSGSRRFTWQMIGLAYALLTVAALLSGREALASQAKFLGRGLLVIAALFMAVAVVSYVGSVKERRAERRMDAAAKEHLSNSSVE